METPPTETPREIEIDETEPAVSRGRIVRIAAWATLAAGLLLFIAFGSVSAISYNYFSFSGRLVRLSPRRSLLDIWGDAAGLWPASSIDWLPTAVLTGCLAIIVACAIAGAWMLLVQAPDPRRRSASGE